MKPRNVKGYRVADQGLIRVQQCGKRIKKAKCMCHCKKKCCKNIKMNEAEQDRQC